MSDSEIPSHSTLRAAGRSRWLALAGLILALAGVLLFMLLIDQPVMRRTGLAMWVPMAAGSALAIKAWSGGRWGVRVLSMLTLLLSIAAPTMFFFGTRLPSATTIRTASIAPDFTLPDQTGAPVSLREARSKERVLLVFYRGHW